MILPSERRASDEGFTLIELLIVLVILPLIIGAAAMALITTVRNDTAVSARISDSENAELSAEYFSRDVQGALEVTTNAAFAPGKVAATGQTAPFVSTAPEICGPQPVLSGSSVPATESLVVALYRPVQTAAPAIDVAYWLDGSGSTTQLTRYSCSLDPTTFVATSPVAMDLGDPAPNPNSPGVTISSSGLTAVPSILPTQFGTAAATGWTPTEAATVFDGTSPQTLGSGTFSLTVASTSGFASGWLTVLSNYGLQSVNCTGALTTTSFTSCTGGKGNVSLGGLVTQGTVSSVRVVISAPSSSYRYVLNGNPRGANTGGLHQGGPDLLVLNNQGISLSGTGSATCSLTGNADKVCVKGSVVLDGGAATCNGGAEIGSSGSISSVSGPAGSTCNSGQITKSPVVPDYIAPNLPSPCFTTGQPLTSSTATSGTLTPGVYANAISNAVLEPGVYVLEGGISGGGITQATPTPADSWYQVANGSAPASGVANYDSAAGVLLYIPGNDGVAGCYGESSASTAVSLSNPPSTAISVAPLDSGQSTYWFSNTNLADMWLWQDVKNANSMTLQGNVSVATSSASAPASCSAAGIAYLPGASLVTSNGSASVSTGRMIVGGVSLGGTPSIYLSGC